MTVPVVRVVLDRRSRRLPLSVLIALGMGAIAFAAGLHFGGAPSSDAAAIVATAPHPTPSAGPSPAPLIPAVASGPPFASPPGWSDFVRRFDATGVIEALPGGANCRGGSPGSWIAPRTGSNPDETFVKTWMTSCTIALGQRDAFLNQVLEAIAPVDNPIWDGLGGVMAVTTYEEGGFVGSVALTTHASANGIEIAVTLEEQPSFDGPTVSDPVGGSPSTRQTPGPATTPPSLPAPTAPVPLPATGALAPGTYTLPNPHLDCAGGCAGYQRIIFTLPAGWATSDGLVYKHLDQPDEVAFSAWTVDQVYADPCHWQGSVLTPLDLANHSHAATGAIILASEVGGLANQALRGARPRALIQVTLGGVGALRIDLSVPADLVISTCDNGEFRSWTKWGVVDGANTHNAPGQLDVVYEVDVDRRPLVIDASHMPATSKADLTELKGILSSMIIDRGPNWATPAPSGG